MKRLERAAVLVSLIEALSAKGSWCGETHIQKATYFLQTLMGVPMGYEFILYKHGPFAFQLSDELTALRADRVLKLVPQPHPYGPSVAPDEGKGSIEETLQAVAVTYGAQIKFIAEQLGQMKVTELERVSTALYVTEENGASGDVAGRAARISKLKPHISLREAQQAIVDLDEIRQAIKSR